MRTRGADTVESHILGKAARIFAQGFGVGLIQKAPGTFGSMLGLVFAYGVLLLASLTFKQWSNEIAVVVTVGVSWLAYVAIDRYERDSGTHDDQRVVADEIAGQMIACLFCPPTLFWYGMAFVFFRFFDIKKPGIIGRIDREGKGAFGTLCDDLLSGLVAGLICLGIRLSFTFVTNS